MFTKIVKKAMVLRLVAAVILLTAMPAQAQAAWTDNIGSWIKENIVRISWAEKELITADENLATVEGIALISSSRALIGVSDVIETVVTGYSSSVDETDSTPFVTASGEFVRDGIVAANFLPFGTKIKIPEIFGNKVFVVKDRMATKHADKVDVWFETKELAKSFGKKKLQIQVLES